MASVTDIANGALTRASIGRIDDINEASKLAADCRAIWPAVRDTLLTLAEWDHARRRVVLRPQIIASDAVPAGHRDSLVVARPLGYELRSFRWSVEIQYRDENHRLQTIRVQVPLGGDYLPAREPLDMAQEYPQIDLPVELTTPSSLTASSEDGYIVLAWSAVMHATDYGYRYRAGKDGNFTTVLTTGGRNTVTIDNLVNGQFYQFQVVALADGQLSKWSDAVAGIPTAVRVVALLVPPQPVNLVATPRSESMHLAWNRIATATSYEYRYRAAGASWVVVSSPPIVDNDVVALNLVNGTQYEFQVRALNIWGASLWSDSVFATPEATAPDAPTGLIGLSGNTRIRLTWNAVATATSYEYRLRLATAEAWTVPANQGTNLGRAIVISGLTNDSAYHLAVRAVNAAGASEWSQHVEVTPTALATPAPQNLVASPGDQRVQLNWDTVGSTIDYDHRYRETRAAGAWTEIVTSGDTDTEATVSGLTNGVEYEFQVRANRGDAGGGFSPWSASVTATPQVSAPANAPTTFSATAGDELAILDWSAVDDAVSYEVRMRAGSTGAWTILEMEFGGLQTTIFDLTNGQLYEFEVRAKNAGGVSAWSATATATPIRIIDVPEVPTNVAVSLGDEQATLTFDASDGALDYDHRYRVADTGGGNPGPWIAFTGEMPADTSTSITITGLTNGVAYDFGVRAGNSAGESDWSASVQGTPSEVENVPPTPTGVSATAGDSEFDASWSGDETADDYRYRYRSGAEWTYGTTTAETVTVANLENGTAYQFQVQARNSAGSSAWVPVPALEVTPVAALRIPSWRTPEVGDGRVLLRWFDVEGETRYDFVWNDTGTAPANVLNPGDDYYSDHADPNTDHGTIGSLTNGTTYYFWMRARKDDTFSDWSEVLVVTPQAA